MPLYIIAFPDGITKSFNVIKRETIISLCPDKRKEMRLILRKNGINSVRNEFQVTEIVEVLNKSEFLK